MNLATFILGTAQAVVFAYAVFRWQSFSHDSAIWAGLSALALGMMIVVLMERRCR